jgi:hypothetical protein
VKLAWRRILAHLAAATFALFIVALGAATFLLDQMAGVTSYLAFDAAVLGVVGIVAAAAYVLSNFRGYLVLPALVLGELVLLSAIDVSPVKPARRAIAAIQPGMTEAQVRTVLDRAFPANGQFRRPTFGPLRNGVISFSLDPTDGRYNAAFVRITFRGDSVRLAEFEGD